MKSTNRHAGRFTAMLHIALAALACAQWAQAQQPPQGKNEAVYMYRGADRGQRLIEKARAEGSVVFYTSIAQSESIPLTKAFEKKYGIKVELWRASSDKVRQRLLTEAAGKRFTADVMEVNGPEQETLAREKLLSEFYSPYIADLPPSTIPPHRLWMPDRLNFLVVAYNTNKVKREELPRTYEGFINPKWKGLIGLEVQDIDWMATIVKNMGAENGTAFFRKLADMKPDLRKGHTLLAELIAAGEVPVGLSVYNSNIESMKRRGGPVDWAPVEPVVAVPQGISVAKNAPHPHAALLFTDFVLSPEGQELFESMGRIPASMKVKSQLKNFPFITVNPATVLDEADKWDKVWNDLFLKK
ncbi:MAG: futA [Herminiimonas sp.]|nr:futA [Herminiimonas sp.]